MRDSPCPHGHPIGGSQLPKGGWFGGVGKCSCCAQTFGFNHSSSYNWIDGLISSRTQDETLCRPCGGKTVEYLHPNYEEVQRSPNVFTIRKKELP